MPPSDLPPPAELAANIKRHIDSLAGEIARRVAAEKWLHADQLHVCEQFVTEHARGVLLDWFLGKFIPEREK